MRTGHQDASGLQRIYGYLLWLGFLLGIVTLSIAEQRLHTALPASSPPPLQHKIRGDISLTINAEPRSLRMAERLHVTLIAEAATHIGVVFPAIADQLGPFAVRRQSMIGPVATGMQQQQWTQEYVLEAEQAGDLILPPLQVVFQPLASARDHAAQQLSTDPITIAVTSVLPEDADVMAPRDVAPPVRLMPPKGAVWQWSAAALCIALALAGTLWYWRRRQRGHAASPPLPRAAHLLALEALERLPRDHFFEQAHIETYYVRLSRILRRYIEWRFGLRAPEQTTEEFLNVVLATGGLIATHSALLSSFLQHCDLVKFARHQPPPDAIEQAWQSARQFVEQTADDQVVVADVRLEVDVP